MSKITNDGLIRSGTGCFIAVRSHVVTVVVKGLSLSNVEGPAVKQPRLSVGGVSEVPLNVEETDLSRLTASIVAPSGHEEPCELKRLDNGQTGLSSHQQQYLFEY